MTTTKFHNLEISREIRIKADWEQSSSSIWWQSLDDWLDTESPAC